MGNIEGIKRHYKSGSVLTAKTTLATSLGIIIDLNITLIKEHDGHIQKEIQTVATSSFS